MSLLLERSAYSVPPLDNPSVEVHVHGEHCDHDHEHHAEVEGGLTTSAFVGSVDTIANLVTNKIELTSHIRDMYQMPFQRLGYFYADPRHRTAEEIENNQFLDRELQLTLTQKKEKMKDCEPDNLASHILLFGAIPFGEEEKRETDANIQLLSQGIKNVKEPEGDSLSYTFVFEDSTEEKIPYHKLRMILALDMAEKVLGEEHAEDETPTRKAAQMLRDRGVTFCNFRNQDNSWVQANTFIIPVGHSSACFNEQVESGNIAEEFNHPAGEEGSLNHGNLRMVNGELKEELCPDHLADALNTLNEVNLEIEKQLEIQILPNNNTKPLIGVYQPAITLGDPVRVFFSQDSGIAEKKGGYGINNNNENANSYPIDIRNNRQKKTSSKKQNETHKLTPPLQPRQAEPKRVLEITPLPRKPQEASARKPRSQPPLTIVREIPRARVETPILRSIPTTDQPEKEAQAVYVNDKAEPTPLTFIRPVKSGGKPKEAVAGIEKTSNPSRAARIEYVNDGVARTLIANAHSEGSSSPTISGPTTTNPREATSIAYVDNAAGRTSAPSSPTANEPRPISSARSYRPDVLSAFPSQPPTLINRGPSSNDSIQTVEPSISRFTTSNIDIGPQNPSPTKPNPNRSLNSGEVVGKTVSEPVEVPSITIGTNLSKAFEQAEENQQQRVAETVTQTVQAERREETEQSAEQEKTASTEVKKNQQQEQVEAVLGSTRQVETQTAGTQRVEAGEGFGSSIAGEEKDASTQQAGTPISQTRQSRSTATNTEAARITEVETPRGKVKIIEGGRATGVLASAPQRATSSASNEEVIIEAAEGTDERKEDAHITTQAVTVATQTTAPVATTQDVKRVNSAGQTAAATLSLRVNNEYLDFENPGAIGDAFKKAWVQALAA